MPRYLISNPGEVAYFVSGPHHPDSGLEDVVVGGYLVETEDDVA